MNVRMKIIAGILLALGISSIAFMAAPIQAYVNGAVNSDLLQIQDQDRLRTQNCNCDNEMLQTQKQERLETQDCACTCNCTQTQYHNRARINQCTPIGTCNYTENSEQYRRQYRERSRSQGS